MRGVYIVKDLDAYVAGMLDKDNNDHYWIKYIGSTNKTLKEVEYNHREETHFYNKKTKKKDKGKKERKKNIREKKKFNKMKKLIKQCMRHGVKFPSKRPS